MRCTLYKLIITAIALFIGTTTINAQVITREDSLNAGLTKSNNPTVISGYGQAKVEYNLKLKTGVANLTRNVLFFGHRFNKNISFFSEMELENAGIDDGKPTGSVSMEQLFLKFNLNKDMYLVAGLFIPRIGMINENHLPTTFNGNDRHFTETLLIPSTWREIGIGLYGNVRRIPGLNYSVALMNGLNSRGFKSGNGIREGRFLGTNATASNVALTASLLYYVRNFRFQASGYFGGSAGLNKRDADSLMLDRGAFGTPVGLGEFNVQYHNKGMGFKALFAYSGIPDAYKINRAYANNTPKAMMGGLFEAGYNILYAFNKETKHNLTLFGRYEYLNLNSKIASNGIENDALRQQYLVGGITYAPIRGVVIKVDYVHRITGKPNPALYINPYPQALPYYTSNGFINIGLGYAFLMERRNFLKAGCMLCGGFIALSTLEACSTLPMYKAKQLNGLLEVPLSEFATANSVIVRHNDLDFDILVLKEGTEYRALYMKCTHEAAPLTATDRGLFCSMHGSAFDLQGKVTKEPATKPLAKFETSNQSILINPNKQII